MVIRAAVATGEARDTVRTAPGVARFIAAVLDCGVAAGASIMLPDRVAGLFIVRKIAATLGRTPGAEGAARVIAAKLVAVAQLILARPVAAVLPIWAAGIA